MSRRKLHAGSTAQTCPLFIQDNTSTVGGGLGGLVFNTSGLAAKYRREGQSAWTAITLATATVGTWASGGFVADGGGVTGGYEFGIPDAVLAVGVSWAEVQLYGAANMLPVLLEFELDAVNYQDAAAFGLSRLLSDLTATRAAKLDFLTGDAFTRLGAPAAVSIAADIAAVAAKTVNLPAAPAAVGDIPTTAQIADKYLGRSIAGGADGGRTVRQALAAQRNKVAFDVPVAGQFTVYAEDDSTPLWTGTYTANANANPVTAIDPA